MYKYVQIQHRDPTLLRSGKLENFIVNVLCIYSRRQTLHCIGALFERSIIDRLKIAFKRQPYHKGGVPHDGD